MIMKQDRDSTNSQKYDKSGGSEEQKEEETADMTVKLVEEQPSDEHFDKDDDVYISN